MSEGKIKKQVGKFILFRKMVKFHMICAHFEKKSLLILQF